MEANRPRIAKMYKTYNVLYSFGILSLCKKNNLGVGKL